MKGVNVVVTVISLRTWGQEEIRKSPMGKDPLMGNLLQGHV